MTWRGLVSLFQRTWVGDSRLCLQLPPEPPIQPRSWTDISASAKPLEVGHKNTESRTPRRSQWASGSWLTISYHLDVRYKLKQKLKLLQPSNPTGVCGLWNKATISENLGSRSFSVMYREKVILYNTWILDAVNAIASERVQSLHAEIDVLILEILFDSSKPNWYCFLPLLYCTSWVMNKKQRKSIAGNVPFSCSHAHPQSNLLISRFVFLWPHKRWNYTCVFLKGHTRKIRT